MRMNTIGIAYTATTSPHETPDDLPKRDIRRRWNHVAANRRTRQMASSRFGRRVSGAWYDGLHPTAIVKEDFDMQDREIRAALDHHWVASDENDFEGEHQIYRQDAVLEYP